MNRDYFLTAAVAAVGALLVITFFSAHSDQRVFPVFSAYGSCTSSTNLVCLYPSYNHVTGNITATIGQNTGADWDSVQVIFVPQGTPLSNGIPVVSWSNAVSLPNGLKNGTTSIVILPATGSVAVQTPISGTIWARYQTNAGKHAYYYAQMGALALLKAY